MLDRGHAVTLCLALASAGCGTILGLGDFEDQEDQASASSSGPGSGGGPGAGGSGGSGATGGGGGTIDLVCQQSEEFEIFAAGEVPGEADMERLFIVGQPSEMRAHVAVVDQTSRQVLARTVRTNRDVSPIVRYPDMPNQLNDLRIMDGYLDGGVMKFPGSFNGAAGEVQFPVQPDINAPGVMVTYPAPMTCGTNDLDVHKGPGGVRFAASCNDGATNRLYGGTPSGAMPDYVISGPKDDPTLSLRGYTNVDGLDVLLHNGDFDTSDPSTYRFGQGLAQLSTTYVLETDAPMLTIPLTVRPTTADDGVLLFTVSAADPENPREIRLRSGVVPAADLGKLASAPADYLEHLVVLDTIDDLAIFGTVEALGDQMIAAGTANLGLIADPTIRLYVWASDGRPIISGQVLKTASGVDFGASVAAPLSPFASMVAWIEQDGAVSTVKAVFVECTTP